MIPIAASGPCSEAKTLRACVHHAHQGLGLGIGSAVRGAESQAETYLAHLLHLILLGVEWAWVAVVLAILLVEIYHRHEGSEP